MSILFLLLFLNIAAVAWLAVKRSVAPALFACLAIYFTSWLLVPIPLTLAMWNRIAVQAPITRANYIHYATIECACFLATLLLFGLLKHSFRMFERGRVGTWTLSPRAEAIVAIAAALTALAARHALLGGSYRDNNALGHVAALIQSRANVILFLDSIASAFLFATMVRGSRTRLLDVFLWIWILVAVAQWLTTGQRVAIVMPCVLALLWLHERSMSWRKRAIGYAVIALFLATVGVAAMLVLAEVRGAKRIELANTAKATTTLAQRPRSELAWKVLQHVQIKFDSISAGAALVEKEGSGRAGVPAYEGALLALVPRLIAPHKPVPGSADGTYATVPARLAAAALGYDEQYVNVGVSPAAIELWHFGAAGLALLVVLNALQLAFVNALFSSRGIVPRTLGMVLVGLPLAVTLYCSGDTIVMNVQRVLVLYGMAALALLVLRPASAPALPAAHPRRPPKHEAP